MLLIDHMTRQVAFSENSPLFEELMAVFIDMFKQKNKT